MRIAIDLTPWNEKPSGVDRYMTGLVRSLLEMESPHEYLLFVNAEDRSRIHNLVSAAPGSPRVVTQALARRARPARLFFQQAILPALIRTMRIDVVHSPAFIIPVLCGRAGHLLTIHDMTSFLLPGCHPPWRRGRLYESVVRGSIRRADLVSVPSPAVRDDVLRLAPRTPADRVRVIPCGVDPEFRRREAFEVAPVLAHLGIRWPYVLYVGTLDPRKNIGGLLESYGRLIESGRVPEHLVITGQPGWSAPDFGRRLEQPPFEGRVHLLGYVEEAHLPFLYAGARLFAYPSLLEGFGFPPLEAMACGTPVVASDSSSLRDNLRGAAELVPAHDVEGFAAAMRKLLSDPALSVARIAAGLDRVAGFRWEAFARSTSACYEEIARKRTEGRSWYK